MEVGVGVSSRETTSATVYLDALTWDGEPQASLTNPGDGSTLWQRAWVKGVDGFMPVHGTGGDTAGSAYYVAQDSGRGLLLQGAREWRDYQVTSRMAATTARAFGLAARVRGMRRYYALLLEKPGVAVLQRAYDNEVTRLAEAPFEWDVDIQYEFALRVAGNELRGSIDGVTLSVVVDSEAGLESGAIAYVVEEACVFSAGVMVAGLR
jgi:hypothetical protein